LNPTDRFETLLANKDKGSLKEKNELIKPENKRREQPARTNRMGSIEKSLMTLFGTGQFSPESMMAAIESGPSPKTGSNGAASIDTPQAVGNVNHGTQIAPQETQGPDIIEKFDNNGTDKTNEKIQPGDEPIKPLAKSLAGETNERNENGQSPAKLNKPPVVVGKTASNSTSSGYVKLYRKMLVNGWFKNPNLCAFWIYCLLKASYKEYRQMVGLQEIQLKAGQFVFGRKQAAEETGLTESQIRSCLKKLKATGNLTSKSTNKFSIITICNWGAYQGEETRIQPANHQQVNHKQEYKNKRKKESGGLVEIPNSLQSENFREAWESFKQHREDIKKPMYYLAEKTMLKKLESFGVESAPAALERAIIGGWPDVVPPKPKRLTQAQMNQGGQNGVVL